MSVSVEVRQTEADYLWAEYLRRRREEDEARVVERGTYNLYVAAQERNVELRQLAESLGLNPFDGNLGELESHLWNLRQEAVREWKYQHTLLRNIQFAASAAFKRYQDAV